MMSEAQIEQEAEVKPPKDITKSITKWILILAGLYFLWYIIGDRVTPITNQARVRAFVTPIVPEVSGQITELHVGGDRPVKQGDVLFEIDDRDYRIAREQAEAQLELAGQEVGANTASVAAAKAALAKAEADLATKQIEANRIFAIEDEGIVSKSDADRTRGMLQQAESNVANALAGYEQAKQVLGKVGQENAKVQSALAEIEKAQLNLSRTIITAPQDGVVSYAKVNRGFYANKGQQIMTFISSEYVWIEAAYKENNLGNLKKGDSVDIILDAAPGQVFQGEIHSVGYGVSFDKTQPGQLSQPEKPSGWMRDPQRFIVFIKFKDKSARGYWREGGQADVITYTNNNFIMNGLGKIWAWFTALITYVY